MDAQLAYQSSLQYHYLAHKPFYRFDDHRLSMVEPSPLLIINLAISEVMFSPSHT